MSKLTLDTDSLRTMGAQLRRIATAFDEATVQSERAANAAGHEGLSNCLVDLARGWDGRRASTVEDIARLSDACVAVSEQFEEIDNSLGAALRGEA